MKQIHSRGPCLCVCVCVLLGYIEKCSWLDMRTRNMHRNVLSVDRKSMLCCCCWLWCSRVWDMRFRFSKMLFFLSRSQYLELGCGECGVCACGMHVCVCVYGSLYPVIPFNTKRTKHDLRNRYF